MKFENVIGHAEWIALLVAIISGALMLSNKIDNQIAAQDVRTDKLYEAFIDLVKETRPVKGSNPTVVAGV